MTRLDGEKKSPLPWIIGLIVLALLAAGIYYLFVANQGADRAVIGPDGVELQDTRPGGLGVEGDADDVAENAVVAPGVAPNTVDNAALIAPNPALDNSAMMDNTAMMNSAMMDNTATPNNAMSNGVVVVPVPVVPAMTPAAAPAPNANNGNDTVATRSKTIETDDKTVTYKKSVKEDGLLMRDKTIVAEPVQEAKKNQ